VNTAFLTQFLYYPNPEVLYTAINISMLLVTYSMVALFLCELNPIMYCTECCWYGMAAELLHEFNPILYCSKCAHAVGLYSMVDIVFIYEDG
jgi:hypothetical protein